MVASDVKVSSVGLERACYCFNSQYDGYQVLLQEEGVRDQRSPKKVKKCELVDYDSLPRYLKHNEFVRNYYRSDWPFRETVLSIFSIHNETLNVWTHLIGFFVFLALAVCAAMALPSVADALSLRQLNPDVVIHFSSLPNTTTVLGKAHDRVNATSTAGSLPSAQLLREALANYMAADQRFSSANNAASSEAAAPLDPITRWPFFAFLFGAMFCLIASSACHLLSCHSEHTSYVMLRLDYAGISALIVASILPQVYYTFACDPFIRNLYTGAITVVGIATVLVSLVPVFETPEFRFLRSGLFVSIGLLGWVPILHKLALFGDRPEALLTTLYEFLMYSCYGIGVVIYTTRVPERWMPGKFDLVGHSHQLFHVLVIAGAYIQYLAVLVYLQWRDAEGC